ncbi:hypothetical protein K7X08_035934 [Anisodus acutangulus]|uniref:Uncharacterized protein n=1 Tax=Anisodus acutangulus TaxID=402998 RepID=A0A9Q1L5E6_9SOLA|nr:hypothetical protein K7X08_035934 [Anisodus acutangulus]
MHRFQEGTAEGSTDQNRNFEDQRTKRKLIRNWQPEKLRIPLQLKDSTTLRDEFSKQDNTDNTPAKGPAKEPNNNSPKTSEQKESKSLAEKKLPADESSSSSSSFSESTDDETIGHTSCLAANMKKPKKVMKMSLVALLILGIGLYVANVMKSPQQ